MLTFPSLVLNCLTTSFLGLCEDVQCVLQAWSAWNPPLNTTGCIKQLSSQSYQKSVKHVPRKGSCKGLNTQCPSNNEKTRTICEYNCKIMLLKITVLIALHLSYLSLVLVSREAGCSGQTSQMHRSEGAKSGRADILR